MSLVEVKRDEPRGVWVITHAEYSPERALHGQNGTMHGVIVTEKHPVVWLMETEVSVPQCSYWLVHTLRVEFDRNPELRTLLLWALQENGGELGDEMPPSDWVPRED